jgi:hypothetical protein
LFAPFGAFPARMNTLFLRSFAFVSFEHLFGYGSIVVLFYAFVNRSNTEKRRKIAKYDFSDCFLFRLALGLRRMIGTKDFSVFPVFLRFPLAFLRRMV